MNELNPTRPGTLADRVEVRRILGVSKQRVHVIEAGKGFPRPIDVLEDGKRPIWNRASIERFAVKREKRKAERAKAAA